jgi:hypothetical protein
VAGTAGPWALVGLVAALCERLGDGLDDAARGGVPGAVVSTRHPSDAGQHIGPAPPGLDVWCHRLEPLGAMRNGPLPRDGAAGRDGPAATAVARAHLLVLAAGDEERLQPQRCLAWAWRAVSDAAVLTGPDLAAAVRGRPDLLHGVDGEATARLLADHPPVRVSVGAGTPEELSALWTAIGSRYRPSLLLSAEPVVLG